MSGGTFMVARSIWDHPTFARAEFSEREAFLWLVSEAAWKPRTVRFGSTIADLERGQLCASVRFMAAAWGWSKSRVARFLAKLRETDMIKNRDSSGTAPLVITLCNYDKFQGQRDSDETKAGQQRDSSGTNYNKGNKEIREKNPPTPRKRVVGDDPNFERFWSAYPRKIAKGQARKAWATAIKKAEPETIIASAGKMEDRGKFTPHPATWLNGERWLDGGQEQDTAAYLRMMGVENESPGNFSGTRHPGESVHGQSTHDLSGVFPPQEEKIRSLPERDIRGRIGRVDVPPLRLVGVGS